MAVLHLDADSFKAEALENDLPVLVDFWAEWCGPCRMLAPVIEELAADYEGKLVVAKLNVDEAPALASEYGVMSIPTLMLFRGGKPSATMVGVAPKERIVQELKL